VFALRATRKAVTVLVVEDDWIIREDIVTDLRQEGWAVLESATGAGALQALHEAGKVDLLITDIGLADALTGWEVAEAFRISHPEVPVIYASGNPANDHRRVAGSIFLSKPIAVSELTATCRKLLTQPKWALIRDAPVIDSDSS
jgi:CheY-like chemotaxis protein